MSRASGSKAAARSTWRTPRPRDSCARRGLESTLLKYVLTRLAWSSALIAMSTVLVFIVLRVLPSDPVIARLGATTGVDPAVLEELRRDAGLDQPIWSQYLSWLGAMFRGDFGSSYFSQRAVGELIVSRLPVTLELTAI